MLEHRRRKFRAGRHHEIGPEQTLGLFVDRLLEVDRERADGDERRDPEHNGEREQQEPFPRSPRIPPRHFEDKSHTEELPTEHTEYTEKSERESLVLDHREMPEIDE